MLGAAARFWNLNWDGGAFTFNPDEATLNTFAIRLGPDLNPHFFYYGSVPIYLYRATAEVLSTLTGIDWLSTERFALVGRAYSALASAATLLVVFLVGRRLWGRHAGLLAAGFLAASALAIQQAHFGTVDSALTLAGALLLLSALNIAETGRTRHYLISGLILGLALAVKLSAASFIILPLVAHLSRSRPRVDTNRRLFSELVPPALLLVVAAVGCLLAAPYYLLDWPELWDAIMVQSNEFSGGYKLSYTWQFIGRTPYIFEWGNLLLWGLGLPLGTAALGGWAWALWEATRRRTALLLLLAAWPTLYLLYIGTWEVRFVRHTLPLVPFCCLFAAGGAVALCRRLGQTGRAGRLLGRATVVAIGGGGAAWGLAVLAIYSTADTRLAASTWMRANLPPGTRLVIEDKNTLLPVPKGGPYRYVVTPTLAPDTPTKLGTLAADLAAGEFLVVPDRRWSAVMPRLPDYPLTGRYYRLLHAGGLGYAPAATFADPPRLGPFAWNDDSAEETFQVFDHPTVQIFRNTGHFSEAELRALLAGP